jgi:hypothetical protein
MAGHDERTGLPGNLTKPFNRTNANAGPCVLYHTGHGDDLPR